MALANVILDEEEHPDRPKTIAIGDLREFDYETFLNTVRTNQDPFELGLLREMKAARKAHKRRTNTRAEEKARRSALEHTWDLAEEDGTLEECGCCFENQPAVNMVYCNGDRPHVSSRTFP